jgi:hypothetical protein
MDRSLWSLEADVDANRDKIVQRVELWLDPGAANMVGLRSALRQRATRELSVSCDHRPLDCGVDRGGVPDGGSEICGVRLLRRNKFEEWCASPEYIRGLVRVGL